MGNTDCSIVEAPVEWLMLLSAGGWLLAFMETSHNKSVTSSFVVSRVNHR